MMISFNVTIEPPNKNIEHGTISVPDRPPWVVGFKGAGRRTQTFDGPDLFEALVLLRLNLERDGLKLLCNGSRRDVFPSPMSRAGGGRKAYIMKLGQPATELVDIFAEAPSQHVVTVDEQARFYQEWTKSLQNLNGR